VELQARWLVLVAFQAEEAPGASMCGGGGGRARPRGAPGAASPALRLLPVSLLAEEASGLGGNEERGGGLEVARARGQVNYSTLRDMRPARASCEARFELPTPAWLRALFGASRAVPTWTDPGYQSLDRLFISAEMGFSELPQPTKHTLSTFYASNLNLNKTNICIVLTYTLIFQ
jgi:hypothetical protein